MKALSQSLSKFLSSFLEGEGICRPLLFSLEEKTNNPIEEGISMRTKSKDNYKITSIEFPKEKLALIDWFAKEKGISRTKLINIAVSDYLKNKA